MNQLDLLYQLERLLRSRKAMGRDALMQKLEISRATLKRYLEILRNRLNVPVKYDKFSNTYSIDQPQDADHEKERRQELPGVWFSQQEIVALLTMSRLIAEIDNTGTLQHHLQPILQRLTSMLGSTCMHAQELQRRVRIFGVARREVPSKYFELVGLALTRRCQLHVVYFTRSRSQESARTLSPQRLIHHRHTWFLDAWCHSSNALKRFSLDAIREAQILKNAAKNIPLDEVEQTLDTGYGIYHGKKLQWATLIFTPRSAVWVASEQWHPDQKTRWLADGSFELKTPYTHDDELLMDIQRHGADVRIKSPAGLRSKLVASLEQAISQYSAVK